jgi:hypothetical protein
MTNIYSREAVESAVRGALTEAAAKMHAEIPGVPIILAGIVLNDGERTMDAISNIPMVDAAIELIDGVQAWGQNVAVEAITGVDTAEDVNEQVTGER